MWCFLDRVLLWKYILLVFKRLLHKFDMEKMYDIESTKNVQ